MRGQGSMRVIFPDRVHVRRFAGFDSIAFRTLLRRDPPSIVDAVINLVVNMNL